MQLELPEIPAAERTALVEALLAIMRRLLDRVAELGQTNQELRDEIARLKGQKPRPDLKPSRLGAAPKAAGRKDRPAGGSAQPPQGTELHIDREVRLHPVDLPEGATFKGYEAYVVQDLVIHSGTTRFLRARYELPAGGSVLAPLPRGVVPVEGGHFGANLGP